MPTRRQHRINELLLEELSMLVAGRVDDPRLVNVTVTRVETTQDLTTAKVYFTSFGGDDDAPATLAALSHAGSFLRAELGGLGLRRLPHLVFARDTQFESGQRVLGILESLHQADGEEPGGEEPSSEESEADGLAADLATDEDKPDGLGT